MKLLKQGLALAVVGAGLAAAPFAPAQAQPPGPNDLVAQIKQEARGRVAATRSDATGRIAFLAVKGAGDLMPGVEAGSRKDAVGKAEAYLDKYAAAFGARPAELERQRVVSDTHGTTVTYTQSHRGVEVFGSTLKVNVDDEGDLTAVSGFAAPGLDLSVEPRLSAERVGRTAVAWVEADPPSRAEGKGKVDTTGLRAVDPTLVVYRKGLTKGEPGEAVLAYQVEVTNGANIRDLLFFDADTGKILNRWTLVHGALDRELHELSPESAPVWSEGDPFPGGLNADQQNLVNSAGESYWLFANAFGRDSYDGQGATMRTVNNDPTISCPNANWNGRTTNYCDGVTSDDVVAHEWGHAYTQFTSGLIYQYQSGALNESYSDVWGETLDLINGREDEGESFQQRRSMACESTAPAALEMSITAPASVAGPCSAVEAAFGGGFGTEPVTPQVVVGLDEANPAGPSTTDGCTAYTNAAEVEGNFVYVDRGTCTFQAKVDLAQASGATGIVVGNNNVDYPSGMSGTADIPGVMVSQADGERFKSVGTATVRIAAEDTSDREVSSRWTVGEKSTAFGGAIRDMWMPTCQGDPGKVSDAEYKCDPTLADSGGVHSNSGVPNHAYALTVDGGDYNGQSIRGIGIDKAANIWWRAQSAYLVPASNFVDAADALEQSCADLTGQPINALTTEPGAGPQPTDPIVADDCAQLAAAVTAVEMRDDPERCDFQPVLDPNAPSLCGDGWVTQTIWSEDFEDGLDGWTTEQELANWPDYDEFGDYLGGFGQEWEPVTAADAPGRHGSAVAYGPTPPRVGVCSGNGVDDFSSRDSIISPVVQLPGSLTTPRLTFDHYVATEALYDGGNVKVSVNNGPFEVVPAEAYLFNAPGQLATTDQGNTNPLAGQPGFTGVDGGQAKGSWGQSQIDVAALGAGPGDTLQVRFDIGRDGCGGVDGWYVDNVELVQCALPVTLTAAHRPEPSVFGQPSSVEVEAARDGSSGAAPTGTVVLTDRDGTEVGAAELVRGRASIALPTDLPVGVHPMTASYAGGGTLAGATTEVTVTVVEATGPTPTPTPTPGPGEPEKVDSDTEAKVRPKAPKARRGFRVVVRVKADEGRATGRVVVRIDGRRIGRGRLENGRLVLKVRKGLRPGKHRLVARYRGSATVERSRDKVTFRVRRR